MSESNAALIPFDRPFKFTVEDLKADYRVNLFERIQIENAELLGMFGEEEIEEIEEKEERESMEKRKESELIEEAAVDGVEDEDEDEASEEEENVSGKCQKKKNDLKPSLSSKKLSRRAREMEYDYDDPFIDDSEITDVYQSVFELMRGANEIEEEEEEEKEGDDENNSSNSNSNNNNNNNNIKKRKRNSPNNFFVYRGSMSAEILAKEFEIDANELIERENIRRSGRGECDDDDDDGEGEGEGEGGSGDDSISGSDEIRDRKRSATTAAAAATTSSSGKSNKKARMVKVKEPKRTQVQKKQKQPKVKKLKEPKPAKEAKPKKASDLINQSVKKFNDLFSSDDAGVEKASSAEPVFNVTGIDSGVLELREVLKRFRDAAVGTAFSPGKFPSALRPRLNETVCAVLRVVKPAGPFPEKLLPALASFLPFSAAALNKLLTKKILGPLMEAIESTELPKMYSEWSAVLVKRIQEGGIVETAAAAVENNPVASEASEASEATPNPATTPSSPVKKRLKFNDEMRQLIFEIIRAEIDLNNLILLNNLVAVEAASVEGIEATPKCLVQGELTLRKNVYQKLSNLSAGLEPAASAAAAAAALLSTTEISKEFSAQKRKHEKRIAKLAGEILFGEAAVEELLKCLHESLSSTKSSSNNINININTNTSNNNSVATVVNVDPLNLFTNEPESAVNADISVIMEKQFE